MNLNLKNPQNRRDFFRGMARYTILGGVLVLGRVLTSRTGEPSRCIPSGVCRECGAFRQCNLPQANAARRS